MRKENQTWVQVRDIAKHNRTGPAVLSTGKKNKQYTKILTKISKSAVLIFSYKGGKPNSVSKVKFNNDTITGCFQEREVAKHSPLSQL